MSVLQRTHAQQRLDVPASLQIQTAFAMEINMSELIHPVVQSVGCSSKLEKKERKKNRLPVTLHW